MIHTIHTCSIDLFSRVEATKDVSLLRRWFNPFPVKYFSKQVTKFFEDYKKVINLSGVNGELTRERGRIITHNQITQLEAIYDGLIVCFKDRATKQFINAVGKKKVEEVTDLQKFIDLAYNKAGVTIKNIKDLPKLRNEITRRMDKYRQVYYIQSPQNSLEISFAEYVLGTLAFMGLSWNGKMTLYQFGELKKVADKKIKELEKQRNG